MKITVMLNMPPNVPWPSQLEGGGAAECADCISAEG